MKEKELIGKMHRENAGIVIVGIPMFTYITGSVAAGMTITLLYGIFSTMQTKMKIQEVRDEE